MKDLKQFLIPFAGLKEGKHSFKYSIDKKFFTYFQYEGFSKADIAVDLLFEKKSTMLELQFKAKGTAEVTCDVTNELYNEEVDSTFSLVVSFGSEFNDDNDEILILPHREYQLNVAQYMYEMIVLAVPAKRVHPGIEDGTLDSEVLKKLEEYSINKKENTNSLDPRWNKLKSIIIDKKA